MHLLHTRTSLLGLHGGLKRAFASRLRRSRSAATEERAQLSPKLCTQPRAPGAANASYIYVHISAGDASCGANMHACMSRRRFIPAHVSWSNSERRAAAPDQSGCRADAAAAPPPLLAVTRPYVPDAIHNRRLNPLFAWTLIQHVRRCCVCPGTSVRAGNARELNRIC